MPNNVRYIYRPLRRLWVVYKVIKNKSGQYDEIRMTSYQTKEEAEKEVYRLNGWKLRNNPDGWFEFFINNLKSGL